MHVTSNDPSSLTGSNQVKARRFQSLLFALIAFRAAGAQNDSSMRPMAVHLEAMAFDAGRGRLVLFGGGPGVAGQVIRPGETWEWTGTRWEVAVTAAAGPGGRAAHAMGYDAGTRRVFLYGGVRDTAFNKPGVPLCDTWLYDGQKWEQAARAQCVTSRAIAALVHHDARRMMLLVDGGSETESARLWRWSRDEWMLIDSSGPRRTALDRVTYDRSRSVLVVPVFSGPDAGVWEWNGAWQHVKVQMPPARSRYGLAYDPRLRRVVLVGGRGGRPAGALGDAWTWDGTLWTEVASADALLAAAPFPRMSMSLVEDTARRGLLLFGGVNNAGAFGDLWAFDEKGWRRIDPADR